jgi:hypothetical protein
MTVLSDWWLWLNVGFVAALGIVLLVMLLRARNPQTHFRSADDMSMRLRLPFGDPSTRTAIAAWARRSTRWTLTAELVGVVALLPLLLTPLAGSYVFIFTAALPLILLGGTVARVAASMRERLFHPAPDVPRVARLQTMRLRDYFGPVRLATPWVLAGLLAAAFVALGTVAVTDPARVDEGYAVAALVTAVVAVAAQVARPWLTRRIIDLPQPAADTLELAWDDAIRTDSLSTIALTASQLSGVAAGMAVAASVGPEWIGIAAQLPTWGMIIPQFIYLGINGRLPLRAALYPRTPVGARA